MFSRQQYSGFDPRTVPGCALWLDAADTNTISFSSGTNVSQWRDKSGNGRDARQSTSTLQPILQTNQLNGLPAIKWDGIDDRLDGSMTYPSAQTTLFVVYQITSVSSSRDERLFDINGNGYGNFASPYNSASEALIWLGSGVYPTNSLYTQDTATTGWKMYAVAFNGTSSLFWRFGTSMSLSGSGSTTTPNGTAYTLGNNASLANDQAFSGRIGEIILFNGNLTTSQRQQVEGYLAWKWGLQSYYVPQIPLQTGMSLWLDAADTTSSSMTFSSGNIVSVWKDKSSNAYSFTPVTGNSSPSLTRNFNGGYPCVESTTTSMAMGTPSNISATSVQSTSGLSYFLVYQFVSGVVPLQFEDIGYDVRRIVSFEGSTFRTDYKSAYTNGSVSTTIPNVSFTNVDLSSGVLTSFFNGSNVISNSGITTSALTYSSGWGLFGQRSGLTSTNSICKICEVLHYNTPLTTSQRQQIEGYLAWKWGLEPTLPAGHPWKLRNLPARHPYVTIPPTPRPFYPSDIDGLALWLDAADPSTIAFSSGSNVSQWRDKSGNGRNTSTLSNAPTFSNNAMRFTTNQGFSVDLTSSINIESAFVVCGLTSITANRASTLLGSANGNGGRHFRVYNDEIQSLKQDLTLIIGNNTTSPKLSANTTYILGFVNNGTTLTHYANGVFNASATAIAYTTDRTTSIGNKSGTGEHLEGYIQEVIVFNTALSASQRQQVEGYLAAKWGLSTALTPGIPAVPSFYNPRDISGCALWLDGSDPYGNGSQPANNTVISTWANKTGDTNATVVRNSPTFTTSPLGITISNSPFTAGRNIVDSSSYTMFMVARATSTSGHLLGPWKKQYDSYGHFQAASPMIKANVTGNATEFNVPKAMGVTGPRIFGLSITSSTSSTTTITSVDGVKTTATVAVGNNYAGQDQDFGIGALFESGTANVGPSATIHEVIVYKIGLTASQMGQIEGYLQAKWNAVTNRHPYYRMQALPTTPLFVPSQLSGLQLWLDAADRNTLSFGTGNNVSQWRDKSGNGYAINQTTTTNQPVFQNSGIQFAVNKFLSTAGSNISNFSTGSATSVFIVAKNGSTNTGWNIINTIWFDPSGTSGTLRYHFSFNQSAVVGTTLYAAGALVGQVTSNAVAINTPAILGFTASSTSASIHTNGSTNTYSGVTLPDASNATQFLLGDNRVDNPSVSTDIAIYEFLGFNVQLSSSQRQQVEGYLAWKWGVQQALPAPFARTIASPLSISGCALWLDAADSSTISFSSGSNVSVWRDKSGNGRNSTNAGTGNPSYTTSIINGLPAIQFNDGNFLETPSFTMNTITRTAFVVYRHTSNTFPTNTAYYNWYPLLGSNTNGFQLYTYRENASPYGWFAGLGIASVGGFPRGPAYFSGNTQPASPNFLICAQRTTSNTGVITYNGTTQTTSFENSTSSFPATDVLRVGRTTPTSGFTNIAGHYIGEIILYDDALTTVQRQQVEAYLQAKWNIAVPVAHPYKNFRA